MAFALLVFTTLGGSAFAQNEANPREQAKTQAQIRAEVQARQAAATLRQQQRRAAFERLRNQRQGPGQRQVAPLPIERQRKEVTPPTITPEDIDSLIQKELNVAGIEPAGRTSDDEFLRRVTLDLTGKLPTTEQVAAFRTDDDPEKRSQVIEELLESEAYAKNWAAYWKDVIQYKATFENRFVNYGKLEEWFAEQFAAHRPWDEVATDLITATGNTSEDGEVNFVMAHRGQPVEVAGEVSRVFLGIQIQCAECHDHTSDPWTRQQFHEFAAFFAGTRARQNQERNSFELSTLPLARHAMPDLENPRQQIPVEPGFFLDVSEELRIPPNLDTQRRREIAAKLVTSQDNPWFARAFVNRIWYELVGEAFYLPIDDIGPTRDPYAAEVIETLADQWQQGGYDVAWLFQTILNTETYQRRAESTDSIAGRTPFASNCPSQLRSDQIFEALQQAIGLGAGQNRFAGRRPGQAATPQQQLQRFRFDPKRIFGLLFGVDPSIPNDEVLGTIPQALFLMNSPQVNQSIANPRGVLADILSENPENPEAIEALYLQVLSRTPTEEEQETCLTFLDEVANRREAFEDILWVLVNSTEFISRR